MTQTRISFEQFKARCETVKAARRECLGWTLSFEQKDYQREWHVIVHYAGISERVQISSARVTQDSPVELVKSLILSVSRRLSLEPLAQDNRFGISITSTGQIHTGGDYLHRASGSIFMLETGELIGNAQANGDTPDEAKQLVRQNLLLLKDAKKPNSL